MYTVYTATDEWRNKMSGIIQRPNPKIEAANEKPDLNAVLLRLDDDDHDKLVRLCKLGDTNKNDILRQCIRHVYDSEMADLDV